MARSNFPVSSAEGPGWQGAFEAVYTDVNKEKATPLAGIDPCSKPGSYSEPDPKLLCADSAVGKALREPNIRKPKALKA